MPTPISRCTCPACHQEADHPDKRYHQELRLFLATLNRQQRRLFAALEANRLGQGSAARVGAITGLCSATIARGRRQLADLLQGKPPERENKPGTGRPRTEQKYPAIAAALEEMVGDEMAGNPDRDQKWVRSSVAKLTGRLRERGFPIGHNAVWALLKRMGFSLRTHVRKRRGVSSDPAERDQQFRYIAAQRKAFSEAGVPVISVDT